MKSRILAFCLALPLLAGAQQWKEISPMLTASFLNSGVAWEGKVYFTGGPQTQAVSATNYNKNLQILDLATETITQAPVGISVGRCGMSSVALDGKIYFMGGHRWVPVGFVSYDNVDIYDVATGTWTLKHLSVPRTACAGAVVKGKIVVAGGWRTSNGALLPSDVVDIYDPATGQWTVQHLSVPRGEMLQAGVVGSKVYVCGGGVDGSNYVSTDVVDVFDIDANTWTTAHLSLARSVPSVLGVGKYLLCAGGYDQTFGKTDRVDILDTETGVWSTHALSQPRALMAAAVLGGKVYFTGGGNLDVANFYFNQSSKAVDVFDSNTNTWSVGQLNKNRMAHACAAWGNKIAVGGGWRAEQQTTTGSVEILTDDSFVAVKNPGAAEAQFEISPNPASDFLTLYFPKNIAASEPAELSASDLSGHVVFRQTLSPEDWGRPVSVPVWSLPPGSYVLSASKAGQVLGARRFVVLR